MYLREEANLYRFVGNNPVNKYDPFGLEEITRISVDFYNSSGPMQMPTVGDWDSFGRQFYGTMATFYKGGGSRVYQVKSGGNVDKNSRIKKRPGSNSTTDDTSVPSGSFNVETSIASDGIGYLLKPQPSGRGFIEIHYSAVTTGCIAFDEDGGSNGESWSKFKCDMSDSKSAGRSTVSIKIWYKMTDGSKPPHGNTGDVSDDSGGDPGPWPDTEGPFP